MGILLQLLGLAKPEPKKDETLNRALDDAYAQYNKARMAFYQSQENFDQASGAYVGVAIEEVRMAENEMDNALRKLRLLQTEQYHNFSDDDLAQAQRVSKSTQERARIFMEIQRRKELAKYVRA
jgi:response regulator of citrate/malate metabolism